MTSISRGAVRVTNGSDQCKYIKIIGIIHFNLAKSVFYFVPFLFVEKETEPKEKPPTYLLG